MNTIGVILARFQPIHNGHLELIKKACEENEKVLLLVGSADKNNERNPIPIHLRIQMLKDALNETHLSSKCVIHPLDDLSSESDNSIEWGFYLYSKIVDLINRSSFTMYYSDGFEIITTWFPGFILRNYVSLVLLARGKVKGGISATEVRKLILNYDNSKVVEFTLENSVPKTVYEKRDIIQTFLKLYTK